MSFNQSIYPCIYVSIYRSLSLYIYLVDSAAGSRVEDVRVRRVAAKRCEKVLAQFSFKVELGLSTMRGGV